VSEKSGTGREIGDGEIGDGSEFQHIAAALPQPPRAGQLRSARPALAEVPLADLF
jgi:hypothetical protein